MDIGLRLAGNHTLVFQCTCFFAGGNTTLPPGWRLCAEHADLQPMIAEAFGEADDECVVACRLNLQRA
jgi:hypothetical protein